MESDPSTRSFASTSPGAGTRSWSRTTPEARAGGPGYRRSPPADRGLGGVDPGGDHLALATLVDHLHAITRLERAELRRGVGVCLQADRALGRPHGEHPRGLVHR